MTLARALCTVTALTVMAVSGSCRRPHTPPLYTVDSAADSARGIVRVVGSEPNTSVILVRLGNQPGPIHALDGAQARRLTILAGLDVVVYGTASAQPSAPAPTTTSAFTVTRFVVRGADGIAAIDGIVGVRRRTIPPAIRTRLRKAP